ncbi:Galactoside 2-alpha-L-fucosyltransferase [Nymphaea thermarum]|nr:Galactoside 2-alpha-L-fucosyltransferase [Nymphaea thermarum]
MDQPNSSILSSSFLSQLISQKLNHSNYLTWKYQIVSFIKSHRLYGHIDGTTPAPPQYIDREVKRTVVADQGSGASTGSEIRFEYETVTENNLAYEVWLAHDQSLVAYITSTLSEELRKQFQDIKRGTRTVLEYLNEIKSVSDQLAAIGHPVSDKDKVQQALSGLETEFDIFCTALEVLPILPSFEDLKAKLFQHEASRVQRQNLISSNSHNVLITGTHAMQGHRTRPWTPQAGMGRGILPTPPGTNTTSSTPRRVPTCFYCNKRGHVKLECWHNPQNKNNHIRREGKTAAGAASSSFGQNVTSNIPADAQQLLMTAISKLQLKQNEQREWYVDSGAAAHVTGDTGNISSVFPYLGQGSVVMGDGSHHTISHVGNARISMGNSSISLKNVLVVSSVKKNIISVSKLIDDTHSSVEFTPSYVYVKDVRTKKTFAEGTRKGDMYVLEEAPTMSKQPRLSESCFPSHSEPWILFKPENHTAPDHPCHQAMSIQPCFHAPPFYDCKANVGIDTGKVVPHVEHCEDMSWGLKSHRSWRRAFFVDRSSWKLPSLNAVEVPASVFRLQPIRAAALLLGTPPPRDPVSCRRLGIRAATPSGSVSPQDPCASSPWDPCHIGIHERCCLGIRATSGSVRVVA